MPIIKEGGRKRSKNDFYETPYGLIDAALNAYIKPLFPSEHTAFRILDPGAGKGRWGTQIRKMWANSVIVGVENHFSFAPNFSKEQAYNRWVYDDYLTASDYNITLGNTFDLVVGNPPYKFAEEFIRTSWEYVNPGGYILFLLRIEFLAGQNRWKNFWPLYMPKKMIALSRRPSFSYDGHTDATDYGLYLWQKPLKRSKRKGFKGEFLMWEYDPELDFSISYGIDTVE